MVKEVLVKHKEGIEAVMVVDQTLLKQVVLQKKKAGWCLWKIAVREDRDGHLKAVLVLPEQIQDDEYEDV